MNNLTLRNARQDDAQYIRQVYQLAFEQAEADQVAEIAVNLLNHTGDSEVISFVAVLDDQIIGHIAFSPVTLQSADEIFAYLLAPLAVMPKCQKNQVGSNLVNHGLKFLSAQNVSHVFVYGDPNYYGRFGFNAETARAFVPPYPLQFPHGWQGLMLGPSDSTRSGKIKCVEQFNDPTLW